MPVHQLKEVYHAASRCQAASQSVPQLTIAQLVGLNRDTVRRSITAPAFPEIVRPGRKSKLDPYKPYLHQRWSQGARHVTHLIAELRERGYRGSG